VAVPPELQTQFGVDLPSPPWENKHGAIFTANYITRTEGPALILKKNEIGIIIDLGRPLKRQFLAALKSAECEQKFRQINISKARSTEINYATYLRILDADEAGASTKHMTEVLFSHSPGRSGNKLSRLVCDYRTAARKLRDGGYRLLLEMR
jgi:hypothetical protein